MFGELPKLFGRDFVIAYFLPAVSFLAATRFVLEQFQISLSFLSFSSATVFRDLAMFGLAALFAAIILSVLNRAIIRTMEGYWPFNLGQYLNGYQKRRYARLSKQEALSDKQRQDYAAGEFPRRLQNTRNKIKRKKAEQFPSKEYLILPTSFGNAFRAFETYPQALYGIDAIPGWYRLLAVVPNEYRVLMDAARGRVDLWANATFLGFLVTIEFLIAVIWSRVATGSLPGRRVLWIPFVTIVISFLAYRFARDAAIEWGHWVKSAFDLYLPALRKALEFTAPKTAGEERSMWSGFNKAVIYREASAMPDKTRLSLKQDS